MTNSHSVDNMVMTGHNKRKLSTYLTRSLRFLRASEPRSRYSSLSRKIVVGAVYAIAASICNPVQLYASTLNTDHYKLYLHSKIINYKQFQCAVAIGNRESHWNPSAVNGSHYGIFQMNNKKVKHLDPYAQIDWFIRYTSKRYKGNYCLSLEHLKKKGWQ